MARLEKGCIGDCSCCELLSSGEVEMIPCVLDQVFQRQRKIVEELRIVTRSLEDMKKRQEIILATVDSDNNINS